MMPQSTRYDDFVFDFDMLSETLSLDTIDLEADEIDRALQLSQSIVESDGQWQTYLNVLARLGVKQWLSQRAPELSGFDSFDRLDLRFAPEYSPLLGSASYARVGDFTLCILAMGSSIDEEISIPRATIELPEFAAHFYIAVEVCEEYDRVTVRGSLSGDRLRSEGLKQSLELEEDWTYSLPLSEFDLDSDRLLLYLRCLEPTAIALPEMPQRATLHPRQRAKLVRLASELPASELPWWQVLTWEDAIGLLVRPELLQATPEIPLATTVPAQTSPLASLDPIVNVASWLRDELDRWAQEAAWVLLPSLNLSPSPMMRSSMRDTASDLETMLQQLQREKQMQISPQARGAYQDLQLTDTSIRLYALTWEVPLNARESEWALLLILTGQPGAELPMGITLQVRDETEILVRRTLAEPNGVLYTQVIGAWEEQFGVQIELASGEILTLPPFSFYSDR
ncbi:MAG: DUF1822 family protein [Cyanobacteriota bacterium]|nr:DUF1822 family protein [Cyanobacteriota bacterium]